MDGITLYDKYKIEHVDGTPLKGKKYFVLRLDSDDPAEAERVRSAMDAYMGKRIGNGAKMCEALEQIANLMDRILVSTELDDEIHRFALEAQNMADGILSAPPRNCDIYPNPYAAEQAYSAYLRHLATDNLKREIPLHAMEMHEWLYAKAESEAAE